MPSKAGSLPPTRPFRFLWPLLLFLAALTTAGKAQVPGIFDTTGAASPIAVDSLARAGADSVPAGRQAGPGQEPWDLEGDDTTKVGIRYQGGSIEYLVDRELIMLTGQAQVRYRDIRVTGDSILFDTGLQELTVSQNPVLYDKSDAIYGDRMVYNFRTRRGWIYNGFTKFDRGRYWGRRIRQVGQRTLNVDYGRYTTCDAPDPHYYFWARRMKIYLDDKLVAQPVVMCFSGIPSLVIPFWFLPLRRDRHSGFLMPRFGTSAYEGVYVKKLAYYQIIDDRSDMTVALDLLERVGWRGNIEGRYIVPSRLSGLFTFSYLEDQEPVRKRWNLNADYSQNLGRRTAVTGRANFLSDKSYYTDFSDNLSTRLDRNLHSFLAVNHSWTVGSLSAAMDNTRNLDNDVRNSRLPEVSATLYRIDLPKKFAGLSGNSYFVNLANVTSTQRDAHRGWDNTADISSTISALRYISISPRISLRATWFDRDTANQRNAWRGLYQGGISASTTIYGLLPLRLGALQGFRHLIQPGVSFSYAPKIDQGRFYSFGSIGTMGEQKYLGLSLTNTFQTKYQRGQEAVKLDLLSVTSSTSYNYLARESQWGGLSSSATVLPGNRFFDVRLSHFFNLYLRRTESTNLDFNLRLSGDFEHRPWQHRENLQGAAADADSSFQTAADSASADSLKAGPGAAGDSTGGLSADSSAAGGGPGPDSLAHKPGMPWSVLLSYNQNWQAGQGTTGCGLRGSIDVNLTRNWKLSYSQYYDLKRREMVSRDYSIYRDLHCWEARFTSTTSGIYWFYEIRISLKAIPELKLQVPKSGTVTNY